MNQASRPQTESPATTHDAPDWGDDILWALSVVDNAVLLLDVDASVRHANTAASMLVARMYPERPDPSPDALLQLLPDGAWQQACAQGRWHGQARVADSGLVIEIAVYCGTHHGVQRLFAVFDDVTARAARELELQQRHEELQRTYDRLASAQEQLLQSEKMASIGQLAAGVAHEINNPIGYVHSNLGTLTRLRLVAARIARALRQPAAIRRRRRAAADARTRWTSTSSSATSRSCSTNRAKASNASPRSCRTSRSSRMSATRRLRAVDLHKGLDSTLNIVCNELKYKVQLDKHYGDAAAGRVQSVADQPGVHEPADQRRPCDRRARHDHARAPASTTAGLGRASPTTAAAFPTTRCTASSIRSSPPSRSASGTGLGLVDRLRHRRQAPRSHRSAQPAGLRQHVPRRVAHQTARGRVARLSSPACTRE